MNTSNSFVNDVDMDQLDDMSRRLRQDALDAMEEEPQLTLLLRNTILAPGVRTFEDAVATTISYRLLLMPCHNPPNSTTTATTTTASPSMFCPQSLRGILADAFQSQEIIEAGHTMAEAVRLDAQAVCDRDPAVESLLEVVLFMKGFAALVCHRAAYHKWHSTKPRKSMVALWLQSQASASFGLDIHPAATMGAGIMLDHGTGVVIGETATVGDGCTLLHGVTLGGTGKDVGDRHPKVGNDVLIGANASLLGNISIGNGAKIGAGSIVLGPIPSGATAVGAPAKIIGRARESKPASTMDETLEQVSTLHKSRSASTMGTSSTGSATDSTSNDEASSGTSETEENSVGGSGWDEENKEKPRKTLAVDTISVETKEATKEKKEPDKAKATEKTKEAKPHKQKHGTEENQTNCCCPFRDYVFMAASAPPGSITICTLRHILKPENCSVSDIGEVLFTLDTRNVGYIKPKQFFTPKAKIVIAEKTKLPVERVDKIIDEFHAQWKAQHQVLKELKSAGADRLENRSVTVEA